VCAVVTLADERLENFVFAEDAAEFGEGLFFADSRGDVQRLIELNSLGNDGRGEIVERLVAEVAKHLGDVVLTGSDMAEDEGRELGAGSRHGEVPVQ